MSLINNVLRELDQRRASDAERAAVPNEVRPLPLEKKRSSGRLLVILGVGAVAIAAVWLMPAKPSLTPSVPVAVSPAPTFASPSPVTAPVAVSPPVTPPVAAAVVATPVGVANHEAVRKMEALAAKKDEPTPQVIAEKPQEPKKVAAEKPPRQAPVTAATLKLDSRLTLRNLVPETVPAKVPAAAPGAAPGANPAPAVTPPANPANPANTSDADVQRAEGMLRQGIVKEAEVRLRRVLATSPEHIAGRQALINLLINAKRSDEAVVVYQEGLARHPAQTPWAMALARLQAERNDYNAAWETLSRSLPHAQQQADYRAFCGAVMQRLNRPREAVDHYRAALTIKPTEARWWVGFGLALEGDRQTADSREAYMRARQAGNLPPELAAFVDQKLR